MLCAVGWGIKALTGGLPPTIPLWSLKLALAYYNSSLSDATQVVRRARQQAGTSPEILSGRRRRLTLRIPWLMICPEIRYPCGSVTVVLVLEFFALFWTEL